MEGLGEPWRWRCGVTRESYVTEKTNKTNGVRGTTERSVGVCELPASLQYGGGAAGGGKTVLSGLPKAHS